MGACSNLSPVDKCLAIIAHGADALQDGNFTLAEGAFRVALAGAKASPPEQGRDLVPLALLNISRLRQKQGRETRLVSFVNKPMYNSNRTRPVCRMHFLIS